MVAGAGCDCALPASSAPSLASTCGGAPAMLFMGLLEVFLRSQCDLEDPCGRPATRPSADPAPYDFIVVGGGSAGAAVAARLSEVPYWRVLLIEAGGDEPTATQVPSMFLNWFGTDIDWNFQTEPQEMACLSSPGRRCGWPRGKVLGGTSVINGMMYIRGSRQDFDGWAAQGNPGWTYHDVLPYFLKSEDNLELHEMDRGFHARGGPLPVGRFPYHPPMSRAILAGGRELGYEVLEDLNGRARTGFAIAQSTARNGSRFSSARAFLRPARARPNLDILLDTLATRVLINATTKRAYGVEFMRLKNNPENRTERAYARKEVVLSGGTVNSPQILLLSGVGPEDDLRRVGVAPVHHLPGVGRNLHNHVAFFVNFFVNESATTSLNWATAMEYLLFRDGLMSGTGVSATTAFLHSRLSPDPKGDNPDLQYFFGGYLANCARTGQVGEKEEGAKRRAVQFIPCVVHPKSRGHLTLRSSNPKDSPAIQPRYLTHPEDVERLVDGVKIAIRLAKTGALQAYGLELDETPAPGCEGMTFGSDEYWRCAVRSQTGAENHQVGSCKMGKDPANGAVVDSQLRVHGVAGLRVMDASVMPVVTSGNTHAPALMIAEKGADLVKSTWLGRRLWTVWTH
ncbi:glucose dehydrogenase [FAD, quinone] [Ischnura elegans]|uniref:glucose dehydrogenase [FAD, quinone] n=1 Tax=Ischnura elegans TaxID=197161 RepID=UPI001ED88C2B|nr:glucose dehydrogenase [FAD, quinone] [Ischnura elegans]